MGGRRRRSRRRPPWLGGAGRKIQIWGPETRFLTKKFDLGWLPSAHEMSKKHRTRTAVGCFDVALTHVDCRVRTQNKNSSKCHLVFLTFANATAFVAKLCPTFASYAASKPMFAVREQDSDRDAVRCQQSIDAVNGLFTPHLTAKAESSDLSAVFQDRIRCGGSVWVIELGRCGRM